MKRTFHLVRHGGRIAIMDMVGFIEAAVTMQQRVLVVIDDYGKAEVVTGDDATVEAQVLAGEVSS